jgi:hypothetical protein
MDIERLGLAMDLRTLTEKWPGKDGCKPDVAHGAFDDWQLSDAIAPSSNMTHCEGSAGWLLSRTR